MHVHVRSGSGWPLHHPGLPRRQALFSELYESDYRILDYSISTRVVSAFRLYSVMLYPLVNGKRPSSVL